MLSTGVIPCVEGTSGFTSWYVGQRSLRSMHVAHRERVTEGPYHVFTPPARTRGCTATYNDPIMPAGFRVSCCQSSEVLPGFPRSLPGLHGAVARQRRHGRLHRLPPRRHPRLQAPAGDPRVLPLRQTHQRWAGRAGGHVARLPVPAAVCLWAGGLLSNHGRRAPGLLLDIATAGCCRSPQRTVAGWRAFNSAASERPLSC